MPYAPEPTSAAHERHDPLRIAAFAAGDLAGPEHDRAADLVASCTDCATLHADLSAIARATAALPAAVRPRDFRLSAEQAARLRPAGWRRLLAAFSAPRFALGKPLGVGLTTLGLAGLLVANVPAVLPWGAAGAMPETVLSTVGSAVDPNGEAAAPSVDVGGQPEETPGSGFVNGGASQGPVAPAQSGAPIRNSADDKGGEEERSPRPEDVLSATAPEDPGPSPLVVASIGALLVGLALLVVRRLATRYGTA